jgi:hypothetical protein
MIVETKMKDFVKGKGMQTASDVSDALAAVVEHILAKAVERAKGNGRKTLRGIDL